MLNVLRPTVATSVYVTLVAHALDAHPTWRARLAEGDGGEDHAFVQEVRRCYPFFPAVTAVVREDFTWRGHAIPRGRRALLDLFGTNHDGRVWADPSHFQPERFLGAEPDPLINRPRRSGGLVSSMCAGGMSGMMSWMAVWGLAGVVVLTVAAIGLVWLLRANDGRDSRPPLPESPDDILRRRYATGELDEDEYLRHRAGLYD